MSSPPPPPVGSGSVKIHADALLLDNDKTLVFSMESVTRCCMTTVALTTTQPADELVADVVVGGLSAVSAQATSGGGEITTAE
ncbi:hypothetical protein ACFYMW_15065 [Streptomyces sp. NPDC006692]|uniref:hypothetical protein n=1 Tax=Streptomyces sp. NPDC006692 TaxID=3364758 RepID=UPI00369285C8